LGARTHWNLQYLKEVFGIHDDQQLMSLVMHGVRWGVQAPLQIRIAANLERLDARIRGVGEAFKKLHPDGPWRLKVEDHQAVPFLEGG
jgi:hypothetical protein